LSGETAASQQQHTENLDYDRALELVTSFAAHAATFEWQEATFGAINGTLLQGLPHDRQGRYRDEPLRVAGVYDAPHQTRLASLMGCLVEWLRHSHDHPLVRVALLHLNLVAIHPFLDSNGRTARVASTLELMRSGVRTPELLSVESYLAAHRDEYFERLRTTIGPSYQPDRHSTTGWVEYYTRISTALLEFDERIEQAWPHDMGTLADHLARRGEPLEWAPVLHMGAFGPVRTRDVAEFFERSLPWARALLNDIVAAGWLRQEGRTRASQWLPEPRLLDLDLRVPFLVRRHEQGQSLTLFDDGVV
ncbi:MAG: Fic family protein, partial [Chloroflexota bacterium]